MSASWTLPPVPSVEELEQFLCLMWQIRFFEEKAAEVYAMGEIGGFCHLCIGQESIAVGASLAMAPQDTMITAYRAHGHAIARGLSLFQVMAELMGREGGSSQGKGGSMHLFHPKNNFYGGHGIVGAQISLGTGIAFSHKYFQDDGVCLTFLGDGATNQGQFFESMNMASLWWLPVLYIIENNGYGMGTSVARACAGGPLYERGKPFGIVGHKVEGDDVISVYQTMKAMRDEVQKHSRPLVLEIDTYRFKGHSMSDPGKYRTREDLDHARRLRDPIHRLAAHLENQWEFSTSRLEGLRQQARVQVEEAVILAQKAPEPDESKLWEDVIR